MRIFQPKRKLKITLLSRENFLSTVGAKRRKKGGI